MTAAVVPLDIPAAEAARVAADIKRRWRAGADPDAAAALAEHPFLLRFKSAVVDLGYEEFCLREARGGPHDPDDFCRRMPAYRSSLGNVLRAHRLLADHPELLADEPDWPAAGDEVGGVVVRAELGRGSFARAYLAYDPGTDRGCVLKLSPTRGGEGRTLGPLCHPHITDVYWAHPVGPLNAVCMPLVGTITLEEVREDAFWAGRPRSGDLLLDAAAAAAFAPPADEAGPAVVARGEPYPRAVAAVAARVADALAYLHARGRDHGDLKPSNVVLGPGAHPYLIDFNLSSPGRDGGGVGGTLPFLAPERLRAMATGVPSPPDRGAADVYAFGATLYALLVGRPPWEPAPGLDPPVAAGELLSYRGSRPVQWPAAIPVPGPVARQVERCLDPDPAARPTAAAVAAGLARWVAVARERPRRRRRWARRAGAAAAVAGVLVAAGWPVRVPPAPAPAVAVTPPGRPRSAGEFVARGRELVRAGRIAAAADDFEAALSLDPTPRTRAHSAYGQTLLDTPLALTRGREAVAAGDAPAAAYNNLAAYLLQTGKPDEALPYLDEAVGRAPDLRAARFNRALARYRTALGPGRRLPDRQCLYDIRAVLATSPESAEAYFHAARICCATAHLDPDLRDEAVSYLDVAASLNHDPGRFVKEGVLRENLAGHPGFVRFAGMTKSDDPARWEELKIADPDGP